MGSVGKTMLGVLSGGTEEVLGSAVNVVKAKGGVGGSGSTVDTDAPSYSIDKEAASRRKRALSLRRGFLSTQRAGRQEETGNVLQPALTGKTKLGQ